MTPLTNGPVDGIENVKDSNSMWFSSRKLIVVISTEHVMEQVAVLLSLACRSLGNEEWTVA